MDGLTSAQATHVLHRDGPNVAVPKAPLNISILVLRQFTSPLVILLLAAALISLFVGHVADAVAILVIVGLNAIVGFFQEHKAEHAMRALSDMTSPNARVVRDGTARIIPATEVVRGDVLQLEPGDVVAADAHLVDAHHLTTVESALTGESLPVHKYTDPVADGAVLAERFDHVFMGTSVATGSAHARVVSTGPYTEIGKIADLLAQPQQQATPLYRQLSSVARVLMIACMALVALVASALWLHGYGWFEILLSSVALAVAAAPEGLPAIVTVALAVGMRRLARHDILVRQLASVETLGSATRICTDKTGTLTTGQMSVRELWAEDEHALLYAASACCDAELRPDSDEGTGNPTELAILLAGRAAGIERTHIESQHPRKEVVPFDAETRRMEIIRQNGVRYVKGAPETLFDMSEKVGPEIREANDAMASRALRVLAVAQQEHKDAQMVLLGLIGIADTPRPGAIQAIAAAKSAGVAVTMLTGDQPATAHAIAQELGLDDPDSVRARVTAGEKTQIVGEFQDRGEIVAMTGDGVNDAPSIRKADIGVAMGKSATEVTRQAADMLLTQDDLGTLLDAVREGRVIYDNIRKALTYVLAGNSAELLLMLVAAFLGMPLPLLPLQLLWINLVTEPFPALALVVEPAEEDVLSRKPRPKRERLLGPIQLRWIAFVAVLQTLVCSFVFMVGIELMSVIEARSMVFSVLVFSELLRALSARSTTRTLFEVPASRNIKLILVITAGMAMQWGLYGFEWTRELFGLADLPSSYLLAALALGSIPTIVLELHKAWKRYARRVSSRAVVNNKQI